MTQTYIGFGSIANIAHILDEYHPARTLLVTGKQSYDSCGAAPILTRLLAPSSSARFSDFNVNPNRDDLERGIALAREFKPDLIVAVGGGSAIDMAKMINLFHLQNDPSTPYIVRKKALPSSRKPLVAVPTTAGSGAEATPFAVVYMDRKKYSVEGASLLPSSVILDPQFTLTLPRAVTATSGLDALAQSIESFWSINSTPQSKMHSRAALVLANDHIVSAVNTPTRTDREAMLNAAHLSGKAIAITKTTAPHAISYTFSSHFGVAHGHAVALTLGETLLYNSRVTEHDSLDPRGIVYIQNTINDICRLLHCTTPLEARNYLQDLITGLGLPSRLSELGIPAEKIATIADNIDLERLSNNPRDLPRDALIALLRSIA